MTINALLGISHSSTTEHNNWTPIHFFVIFQFILQILLLFPQIGAVRVPMRIASFGLSLIFLFWFPPQGKKSPANNLALGVIFIYLLNLAFHPLNNSFLASLAHFFLCLAIIAPLFWVQGLQLTSKGFESLICIIWGFHSLSAFFGVLQTYFPGKFQPALSTAIQNLEWGGDNLRIVLADGAEIYRPMGLTDTPGGAATAGLYAVLFGVAIALKSKNPVLWLAGAGSSAIGLYCILLSQVRSILVVTIISLIFFALMLLRQADIPRLTVMSTGVGALFVATFSWAIAVGGSSTLERITTLTEDDAGAVYQENRGHFLQYTIEYLLPQYPLGAGLGRWGMMNSYFGNPQNSNASAIWVEIQWTGWLLDGGVPLILVYVAAIATTGYVTYRIAVDRRLGDFAFWGALVLSYDFGGIATTFNYPLFIGQGGMEFWLLNAALFMAARQYQPRI